MKPQLFAVTNAGLQALPIPPNAVGFDDLYDGLALGVYSNLRTYQHNKFLHLDAHLARTKRSIDLMGLVFEWDERPLRAALHEAVTAFPFPDCRARFDVLREPAYALGTDGRLLLALVPFTPPSPALYETGVRMDIAPELSRHNPLAKTADFAVARHQYVLKQGENAAYEYLLTDGDGAILEGMGSNFYGVRDGVVYTADAGVLQGVTRRIILELLPAIGVPLALEPVGVADLQTLDEAALSSSSRALLPVVQIGETRIGNGRPGPLSRRILAAYNEYLDQNVKTAV